MVGDGLAQKVGNGRHVRIGTDPWVGSRIYHILQEDVRQILESQGILFLIERYLEIVVLLLSIKLHFFSNVFIKNS